MSHDTFLTVLAVGGSTPSACRLRIGNLDDIARAIPGIRRRLDHAIATRGRSVRSVPRVLART
jgi:hypothetical protein